jgi:glucose-6-phosphate dehydrogenase assembly protein OpcA
VEAPVTVNEIERFTTGQTVGVDVAAIERDLGALWRKASTENAAVTRACSWNLVVHTSTDKELERARRLADALVAVVPSRTVMLNERPDAAGSEVEAFVTANCKMMPGGGKLVCTEEITIEAHGRGGDHLPSLLRALLVPDIPSAVLWAGLPPNTAIVAELLVGVDRVVLDSRRAPELFRVEQLGAKVTSRVTDLNWLRWAPLRMIVASAFDPPVSPTLLFGLDRVSVECTPGTQVAGRLLIGWLGARLGWGTPERMTDTDVPGWVFPRQGGQVVVELRMQERGAQAVTFVAGGEHVKLMVTNDSTVSIDTNGATRTVAYSMHKDEELVIAALGSRGSDKLYASALHRAVELER